MPKITKMLGLVSAGAQVGTYSEPLARVGEVLVQIHLQLEHMATALSVLNLQAVASLVPQLLRINSKEVHSGLLEAVALDSKITTSATIRIKTRPACSVRTTSRSREGCLAQPTIQVVASEAALVRTLASEPEQAAFSTMRIRLRTIIHSEGISNKTMQIHLGRLLRALDSETASATMPTTISKNPADSSVVQITAREEGYSVAMPKIIRNRVEVSLEVMQTTTPVAVCSAGIIIRGADFLAQNPRLAEACLALRNRINKTKATACLVNKTSQTKHPASSATLSRSPLETPAEAYLGVATSNQPTTILSSAPRTQTRTKGEACLEILSPVVSRIHSSRLKATLLRSMTRTRMAASRSSTVFHLLRR